MGNPLRKLNFDAAEFSIEKHRRKEGDGVYLHIAAECLETGKPMTEPLRLFLAGALRSIAQGQEPKKALLLESKRGPKARDDHLEIAEDLYYRVRSGMSLSAAAAEVAATYGCNEREARRYLESYREYIEIQEEMRQEQDRLFHQRQQGE